MSGYLFLNKKTLDWASVVYFGGGIEIRTRAGYEPTVGFQDRSLQPLGYASSWWTIQGLNLWPNPYKGFALTTALMVQKRSYYTLP